MIEKNVEFQEKYKQLDTLCKDIFSSKDGVSVYISEWENVYKQLKHLRWIRNQLAHEVGAFNSDICSDFDLKWLTDFYDSILNRTDPLAIVGQAQRNIKEPQYYSSTCIESANRDSKVSLWNRIKAKIKSWFS